MSRFNQTPHKLIVDKNGKMKENPTGITGGTDHVLGRFIQISDTRFAQSGADLQGEGYVFEADEMSNVVLNLIDIPNEMINKLPIFGGSGWQKEDFDKLEELIVAFIDLGIDVLEEKTGIKNIRERKSQLERLIENCEDDDENLPFWRSELEYTSDILSQLKPQ